MNRNKEEKEMKNINAKEQGADPYLRLASDFETSPGLTPLDMAKRTGSPSLVRTYETIRDKETKTLRRDPNEILCKGAAAGQTSESEAVHHFAPGLRFRGFVDACVDPDRVVLTSRGSVLLKVSGATDRDRGKVVHCHGPNSFTLVAEAGSAEVGMIRYLTEYGQAAVAFRAHGDERPLDLNVRIRE